MERFCYIGMSGVRNTKLPASVAVSDTFVSILAFFVFSDGNVKAQSNPHDKLISRGETASVQIFAGRVAVLGIVAAKQECAVA